MFSQAEWTRSRDVPASLPRVLFPSQHSAKPSRVFHAPQALAQQQTLSFTSSNDSCINCSSAITHHIPYPFLPPHHHLPLPRQPHHHNPPQLPAQSLQLAAAATSPTTTPSRARPRSLTLCSLSSAAQGRHSGSRDSEPLGPLILTQFCRHLESFAPLSSRAPERHLGHQDPTHPQRKSRSCDTRSTSDNRSKSSWGRHLHSQNKKITPHGLKRPFERLKVLAPA